MGGFAIQSLPARAQAAQSGDAVHSLKPVEVVGQTSLQGATIDAKKYSGNVQQADDSEIERSKSSNLAEFMNTQLGSVTVNEVQGSPFQVDVNYRGHRLSPILGSPQGLSVYLDGVRVNEPFGDVMNWDLLPESAIANVSLLPGSNPLYGLNTLGGALVLNTKSGLTHQGTEMDLSMGGAGRQRLDFSHGRQWGDGWHAFGAATLFNERGWRENSQGKLGNVFLKLGRKQADVDWNLSYLRARSDLLGNGLLNQSLYDVNHSAGYTFSDHTLSNAQALNLNASFHLNPNDKLSALLSWGSRQRNTRNGDISNDWAQWKTACAATPTDSACTDPNDPGYVAHNAVVNSTSSQQVQRSMGFQWSHRAVAHQLAMGAEWSASRIAYDQFSQEADFGATRSAQADTSSAVVQDVALRGSSRTQSLYASDVLALTAATQLTLSARWNKTIVQNDLASPAPVVSESFGYAKLNPAIGLTHALMPGTHVFASVSQGTRVPTALELGCADPAKPCVLPTGLQSDPYLKQVVAHTMELGLRSELGNGLRFSGALFRTLSHDDIAFVNSGFSQAGYFTNIGDTLRQGIELALRGRSGPWQWHANYTYLNATYQSLGVLTGPLSTATNPNTISPGTPIAGLPKQVLKLGADWRFTPQMSLGADWFIASSQTIAGNESGSRPELGTLAGYSLLNVRGTWQIEPRWQAYVRLNNLLNKPYASYASGNVDFFPQGQALPAGASPVASRFIAPGAGRTLYMGLRYEWE